LCHSTMTRALYPRLFPTECRRGLPGKGLRCEDKPFRPCLTLQGDPGATLAALGLPLCANPAIKAAVHALVANLIWLVQMSTAASLPAQAALDIQFGLDADRLHRSEVCHILGQGVRHRRGRASDRSETADVELRRDVGLGHSCFQRRVEPGDDGGSRSPGRCETEGCGNERLIPTPPQRASERPGAAAGAEAARAEWLDTIPCHF
jgi:hypothetical protein